MNRSACGQHQQMSRPGEGHVELPHQVELGDPIGGLVRHPLAVRSEKPSHRVRVAFVQIQRTHDHHVPLQALGLVNGGDHDLRPRPSPRRQRPGGKAAGGHMGIRQAVQVGTGEILLHAVQQQPHLVIAGDHALPLEETQQLAELASLLRWSQRFHRDHGRISAIAAGVVGRDGLVAAEGPALRIEVAPVRSGHPAVISPHDVRMRAVVDVELHRTAVGQPVGEPEDVLHAGTAKPVQRLVLITHHAEVSAVPDQPQQDALLDVRRVLVLVAHQIPDAASDLGGDPVAVQQLIDPDLQVGEIHQVPVQQQAAVPGIAAAQGGQKLAIPVPQVTRLDHLVADAAEELERVVHHRAPATPATQFQFIEMASEDLIEALQHQNPLCIFVQQPVAPPQSHPAGVGLEDAAAQAVNGGDADLVDIAPATGGHHHLAELLPQLAGGTLVVGAHHQLLGLRPAREDHVGTPESNGQGFAGARSGDAQGGTVQMADEFQLAPVQLRIQPQYGGHHARSVVHVGYLLIRLIDGIRTWNGEGSRRAASRK